RIAALEQRAAERETQQQTKIAKLEDKLRAIEYAQPIKQRTVVRSGFKRIGREGRGDQWFETAGLFEVNGDFQSNATQILRISDPQRYGQRGRTVGSIYDGEPAYVVDPVGDEFEYFWIAPSTKTWQWSHPVERGLLLGVELKAKSCEEESFYEVLEKMLE